MTDGTQRRAGASRRDLRLRAERPRVTRLSRKVLIGLGGAVGLAIAAALIYALQTRRGAIKRPTSSTPPRTARRRMACTALPRDYTGIPRLGPPLPGDLGRPILNAQNQGQPVPPTGPLPQPGVTPRSSAACRRSRRRDRASCSPRPRCRATPSTACASRGQRNIGHDARGAGGGAAARSQCHAEHAGSQARLPQRPGRSPHRQPDRLAEPASPYVVQAGAVIPAALITGIRSDLPGQVTAQVTEHVYDSPTGRFLLIPQGARLIGQYDSQVAFGQKRVLLVWNRHHASRTAGPSCWSASRAPTRKAMPASRTRSTIIGGISSRRRRSPPCSASAPSSARATTRAISSERYVAARQDSINKTGQQIVRRQLNVQPTLTIRPGLPGARDRQPRSRAGALRSGGKPMTKLKLGAIADDKPVKLTVELPAAVHRDLVAYAEALGREGRAGRRRSGQAHRADDRAVHGDGQSIC